MIKLRKTHNFVELTAMYEEEIAFKGEEAQELINQLKDIVEEIEQWNEE